MNPRIQELVGQAKFMAEETINRKISKNAELDAFAEKFAELILRECIAVHEDDYGVDIIGGVLRRHFEIPDATNDTCPRCGDSWSGTSCGIPECGWVTGVEELVMLEYRLKLHQDRADQIDRLMSEYGDTNWPGGEKKFKQDFNERMVLTGIIKELKHIMELQSEESLRR